MSDSGEGPAAAGQAWWALLPSAQAGVSCGEHSHRLIWSEGRLTAPDHPDAEGELVLAALGGERSRCMDLVEAWGRHSDDLEVLAIGPRSAADELTIDQQDMEDVGPPGRGWFAYAPLAMGRPRVRPPWPWARMPRRAPRLGPPRGLARLSAPSSFRISSASGGRITARVAGAGGPRNRFVPGEAEGAMTSRIELMTLLALGPDFQWRLSASVAAAWAGGGGRAGGRDNARPALVAALAGRLAPAAQAWAGIDPGQVDVSVHEDAGWGRLALSGDGAARRLSAALPVSWLASVWAAGLAVTAGHLVVAVTEAAWPDATVLGVPEPGADPVILEVRAADGAWGIR
jgi:hypothetical protein